MFKLIILTTFLHVVLVISDTGTKLKSYSLNIKETSVSGISSGGYFATQMQVSHSSIIKGAGIIASGPYNCAAEHFIMYCMQYSWPFTFAVDRTKDWSGDRIDLIENMKNHKIYMISGKKDHTVSTSVVDQLYSYYKHFVYDENIVYNKDLNIAHTFSTDFYGDGNSRCDETSSPFISTCGFDTAGTILKHIYGDISNRTDKPTGDWIVFDQSEFVENSNPNSIGLSKQGFIYVPKYCQKKHEQDKDKCRLHIAFHGCHQNVESIGLKFIANTGYDRWADNNRLIILKPQTHSDMQIHWTSLNGWLNNMNGCWDWVGWYDSYFQSKRGKQISTIKRMIDRITAD